MRWPALENILTSGAWSCRPSRRGVAVLARKLYDRCGIQGTVLEKQRASGPVYEFAVKDPARCRR